MLGFGLDVSGYSTATTCLAVARLESNFASATILTGSALSERRHGVDDAQSTFEAERIAISRCLKWGSIAIDVPIDLQGLPEPDPVTFIWELAKRPVDYAFSALAPLSDRIGVCVARFKALLSEPSLRSQIGTSILETYPAGSLRLLNQPFRSYKGEAGRDVRTKIAGHLGLDKLDVSDHELDAIICAVTAAAPKECRLEGARLVEKINELDPFTSRTLRRKPPIGYVLIERWPVGALMVSRANFDDWIGLEGQANAFSV